MMCRREPPVALAAKSFHLSRIGRAELPGPSTDPGADPRGPPRRPPRTAVSSAEAFPRSFPAAPPPQSGSKSPFPAAQNVPSFTILRPCRRSVVGISTSKRSIMDRTDHVLPAPDKSCATYKFLQLTLLVPVLFDTMC